MNLQECTASRDSSSKREILSSITVLTICLLQWYMIYFFSVEHKILINQTFSGSLLTSNEFHSGKNNMGSINGDPYLEFVLYISKYTPGAFCSHCCSDRGAVGESVPCSRDSPLPWSYTDLKNCYGE